LIVRCPLSRLEDSPFKWIVDVESSRRAQPFPRTGSTLDMCYWQYTAEQSSNLLEGSHFDTGTGAELRRPLGITIIGGLRSANS